MGFYPARDDKAKQFPSSQMLLPRRHCCVLCLHFKNLFGQNGVWKCWNEKFSNLTQRFERCFLLQMFRYLFWSSNKLWKKTEKGLLFFVRIWLLYSWKDVPERMENCKQYIIFLYRWTPTMICSSRLVIGWFILRVGCEICPAGHWTFFWGI